MYGRVELYSLWQKWCLFCISKWIWCVCCFIGCSIKESNNQMVGQIEQVTKWYRWDYIDDSSQIASKNMMQHLNIYTLNCNENIFYILTNLFPYILFDRIIFNAINDIIYTNEIESYKTSIWCFDKSQCNPAKIALFTSYSL